MTGMPRIAAGGWCAGPSWKRANGDAITSLATLSPPALIAAQFSAICYPQTGAGLGERYALGDPEPNMRQSHRCLFRHSQLHFNQLRDRRRQFPALSHRLSWHPPCAAETAILPEKFDDPWTEISGLM